MVKTRSKGNERDKRSCTNINLATKKLIKRQGNLSSNSKGSNSNKRTSVPSSNAISPSPLRRSKRETPTKRIAHLSGTAPSPSPSPSTKKKNLTSNSNPSSKKTVSMEKMKSVSGGSSSSAKSPKKKSKGKEKAQAEDENTQTCKRNLSSSSPLTEKEEGSSAKRQRVLLHAKAYKELFKPRTKISKPSPPGEKAQAVEAPADGFVIMQVDTHVIVDAPVEKASCLRCEV